MIGIVFVPLCTSPCLPSPSIPFIPAFSTSRLPFLPSSLPLSSPHSSLLPPSLPPFPPHTLAVGDIPFDDERISGAEFAKAKEECAYPFGQLPVLVVESKTVSQSQALLRYAVRFLLFSSVSFPASFSDSSCGSK